MLGPIPPANPAIRHAPKRELHKFTVSRIGGGIANTLGSSVKSLGRFTGCVKRALSRIFDGGD